MQFQRLRDLICLYKPVDKHNIYNKYIFIIADFIDFVLTIQISFETETISILILRLIQYWL